MDGNKQSFGVLDEAAAENTRGRGEGGDYKADGDEKLDEFDGEDDGGSGEGVAAVGSEQRGQFSELLPKEERLGGSHHETLAAASSSLQLSENDLQSDFPTSHHQLSEVPVEYALLQPLQSAEFKDLVGASHQQALLCVTTKAAQAQSLNQIQSPRSLSSSELSPTCVKQSPSSIPRPTFLDQNLSTVAKTNGASTQEVECQFFSDPKTLSAVPVVKTPSTDGYNWRKYGQKQVKSPQGHRSYYRCTSSNCQAKKIECCDHLNHIIDIVSKGQHSHDPPRRINCPRDRRNPLPDAPNGTAEPARMLDYSDQSTSSRELIEETSALSESKGQKSTVSDGTAEIVIKAEQVDEPEPKRRMKNSNSACPGSIFKPGKKPKFVVHAAGDVGISGDGYRWRKYGQKMVKGNPHPRNYYRCTSAGCPVRKHIERAVDNTTAVIITYKGVHDHDTPVPKKRHGQPSAPLVAAAAPAAMNNSQSNKTEVVQNQISATQWSVDTGGELTSAALNAGEEKAIDSARTLLSIGFEIKQC